MIRTADDLRLETYRPPATPDPTPEEIRERCLVIQSWWSDSLREERAVGKRRQQWEVVRVTEVELVGF